MPNDIIRQPHNLIPSTPRHLSEALGLSLILKGVARKIDAGAVDVGFDHNVDAADAVEGELGVFVGVAVAEAGEVGAVGGVLFVACGCC